MIWRTSRRTFDLAGNLMVAVNQTNPLGLGAAFKNLG